MPAAAQRAFCRQADWMIDKTGAIVYKILSFMLPSKSTGNQVCMEMETKKKNSKSGFTLVEILIAALIIALLVVGGAATLYHTGSNIRIEGNRRIALQMANQRLEHARQNYYYSIVPPVYDVANTYFLTENNAAPYLLDLNNSKQTETMQVDDVNYTMTTEVIRHSSDSTEVSFEPEVMQVTVNVEYAPASGLDVELTTLILPPEVTE
jgi:prepilin-type N-terminal cleavage/methylation domain-containing protein